MNEPATPSTSASSPAAPPPPLTDAERRAQVRRAFVEAGGTDKEWADANGWAVGDELTGSTPRETTTIRLHHFDAEGDCFARVLLKAGAPHNSRVWSAPVHQPLRHRDWQPATPS